MTQTYDIVGLGNAIMDVIAPVSDDTLSALNIERNAMQLIDEDRALELTTGLSTGGKLQEISGGSAANTIAGMAELGIKAAYLGKVASDDMGARFKAGMNASGVKFDGVSDATSPATARSLIAVTPNGDRSMNTFLGISTDFGKGDIDADLIKNARLLYMEGYLFDKDAAKAAYVHASQIAKDANVKVALTLSDSFCVGRHRDSFKDLVANHVDILFANEDELLSLYEQTDFDAALAQAAQSGTIACVTRGAAGSVISDGDTRFDIDADPVDKVVDTTGAGDQYAAGVLTGYLMDLDWQTSGQLGSLCAAEVISHYGARPETSVKDLAAQKGLKL